jgi:cytochrome P450
MTVTDPLLAGLRVDPETPGWFNDPTYFDVMRRLRRESPVHQYADGSWVVARYDDVRSISRDPERFCSGRGVLMSDPPRHGTALPGSILHMDPPDHAGWRKLASRWFTPRGVSVLHDRVEAITGSLLDELTAGDEIDFVGDLGAVVPVLVIAELLGVGDTDPGQFRRWSDACIDSGDTVGDPENARLAGELFGFLVDAVARRRVDPRDDLITTLAQSEVDGRPLADHEAAMYALSLLVAGNETTRHLLSGSVDALFAHPDQRARLAADPDAVPNAIEECLRWVTPIQTFGRTATVDVVVADQQVREGDWVVMLYASANRDEAAFGDDANSFDVFRAANPAHVAFGFGEHLCLGASLARLEARLFLTEFLRRFPDYEITGEPTWTESTLVRGMTALPMRLG